VHGVNDVRQAEMQLGQAVPIATAICVEEIIGNHQRPFKRNKSITDQIF
jgi:hypothetical protein